MYDILIYIYSKGKISHIFNIFGERISYPETKNCSKFQSLFPLAANWEIWMMVLSSQVKTKVKERNEKVFFPEISADKEFPCTAGDTGDADSVPE